jgi:hypothetical protein
MHRTTIRRTGALLVSAALLASLAVATVAAPTAAARPKCDGRTATIVGTYRSETIRGTNRADVIVAKGGNDIIRARGGADIICAGGGKDVVYGHAGRDRLFGSDGRDRLFGGGGNDILKGQGGNDKLDGGSGTDRCYQGTGTGTNVRCELPVLSAFQTLCEKHEGSYAASKYWTPPPPNGNPVTMEPSCEWVSTTEAFFDLMKDEFRALDSDCGVGRWEEDSYPVYVGCPRYD